MAFTHSLADAARRHLQAADQLCVEPAHRKDVAGYLYGIAAECAIKQMVISIPMRPEHDKKKIEFSHFPELLTLLRDALEGRNAKTLAAILKNKAFMSNWHIKMRYADARQIKAEWVTLWQKQAKDTVGAMGT